MTANKSNWFILLFIGFLFTGCDNSLFTPKELEVLDLVNKITKQENDKLNEKCEKQADGFYDIIIENGEKQREVELYDRLEKISVESDSITTMLNYIEQAIIQSKLDEKLIDALGDSLSKLQLVFVQEVPKDEHYSFPYFFTYPDSNSLFKLEKPVSFYSAYFKSVPKELALLHIRQLRQSFLIAKILILDLYCMQVGSNSWYFDIILPFIIPKSTIVDNNTVYEAKILLGYINRTWPDILFNGKKLECPPGEYHCDKKIEFTAPKPDHYDSSGLSKQQWTATVLLKKRKADSLLTITRDYYVRKPCK